MTEEDHYRKQVCELYGKEWKQNGKALPPKGDGCEDCVIKWKCRKASEKAVD